MKPNDAQQASRTTHSSLSVLDCAGTPVTLHLYDFMTSGEGQAPGGLREGEAQ